MSTFNGPLFGPKELQAKKVAATVLDKKNRKKITSASKEAPRVPSAGKNIGPPITTGTGKPTPKPKPKDEDEGDTEEDETEKSGS